MVGTALLCLFLSFATVASTVSAASADDVFDTCIVGGGPAGLQLAYFQQQAGRSYIVFEKASSAGAFFQKYPVHRRLISINKIYVDRGDFFVEPEDEVFQFSQRHDWNSLISHDQTLLFSNFSREYYPIADDLVPFVAATHCACNLGVQSVRPRSSSLSLARAHGGYPSHL